MSDASSAPGSSRTTTWLAAASALAAVALSVYALTKEPSSARATTSACTDAAPFAWTADGEWLGAWDHQASGARAVLEQDLEAWGERWSAARQEACALQPPAGAALVHCLDRQGERARALATALQSVPAERQALAFAAGTSLPPTEDCAGARTPPQTDPELVARLDRAQALLETHQPGAAAEVLDGIDLGDDPLRGRLRWLRGRMASPADAPAIWQRALGDAIAHDQPALACSIALQLAATTPTGIAAAQQWWALASAHARRLPTTAGRQYALLRTQADLLDRHGQPEGALALYEPALAVLESARGGTHPSLVDGLRASAVAAAALGKLDSAERLAKRALELTDDGLGARHPEAIATLEAIASALQSAGAPEKATAWRRMELQRRDEATHGPTLAALGQAYLQAQNYGDAKDTFERAATWAAAHDDESVTLQSAIGRAAVAQAKGNADVAADHLQAAYASASDPGVQHTLQLRRVAVLLDAERWDDARKAAAAALEAAEGRDDATRGEALSVAADVALRSDHADEAIVLARRAVARLVRAHGREHPSVLVALTHLGTACLDEGRNDDAAAAFARATAISTEAASAVRIASALGWATALWRTGAREEAEAIAQDAYRIAAQDAQPGATADVAAWMAGRGLEPPTPAPP